MMSKLHSEPNQAAVLPAGDLVDRGCWGQEVVLLFACWKLAFPKNVFLLRGNHETLLMNLTYGFADELRYKYGDEEGLVGHSRCMWSDLL